MKDVTYKQSKSVDLQNVFLAKVYGWMFIALLITAFTALFVSRDEGFKNLLFGNRYVFWGVLIAELILVFVISGAIQKLSPVVTKLLFILYSILNGITMSFIFLVYTSSSISLTFFITAGTFGLMSIYGYLTKKDLTKFGNILIMALLGIIIAFVVNFFLKSQTLQYIISIIGIIVFVGLVAYDTQKLKRIGQMELDENTKKKLSIIGALSLYLDFINLFLLLLQFFGGRRS